MLTRLTIENFTIVLHQTITFDKGMSVLTGETGAGKSILIDAINLVMGNRADVRWIRPGATRCVIHAVFEINNNPDAQQWLTAHEINVETDCILRRIIGQDGRSQAYINDYPVTLQSLRELSTLLIDIHGQHQSVALLNREQQQSFLDSFSKNTQILKEIHKIYQVWKSKKKELDLCQSGGDTITQRIDFLKYQTEELETLNTSPAEIETLHLEQKKLSNIEQLTQDTQIALSLLTENETGNIASLLNGTLQRIHAHNIDDVHFKNSQLALEHADIQIQEAVLALKKFSEHLQLDPQRLQTIESRLTEIYNVARKHRVKPEDLANKLMALRQELESLTHADEHASQLTKDIEALEHAYQQESKILTQNRTKRLKPLAETITATIQPLGMPHAELEIKLIPLESDTPNSHGAERVEFYLRSNPGLDFQPLNKIASGGELSRVGLAVYISILEIRTPPTLIFDEVDAGIGGGVAEMVGQLLKTLGTRLQVMCVTHSPQIASLAHHQYKVSKKILGDSTQSQVDYLDHQGRILEVARMLGGVHITEQTLAHAAEMLRFSTPSKTMPLAETPLEVT